VLALAAAMLAAASAAETAPDEPVPPDPEACASGFVHRLATSDDRVCVPPQARERTVQENKHAPSLVDPNGAYGPASCVGGYVWREAFPGDTVCVTPAVRSIVREENLLAHPRLQSSPSAIFGDDEPDQDPQGPWLCGEETTDVVAKTRSGHVIDREGRVWAYGYGRAAARLPFDWRQDRSAAVTFADLSRRYRGATRAGRDIAVEDIAPHLPLIEEAAKSEALATDEHDAMTSGVERLYCLLQNETTGNYREVVLEQRGVLGLLNPSPAARELKDWFQPHFWIID